MTAKFSLDGAQIKHNIQALQAHLSQHHIDAAYISSFDPFMSEYVPLSECHRYYFSGFTGSTAELIVPNQGKVVLFVDGRYFEQADLEVDLDLVEVFKCPANTGLKTNLMETLVRRQYQKIGFEADRTPLAFFNNLETANFELINLNLTAVVNFSKYVPNSIIDVVDEKYTGLSVKEKLANVIDAKDKAYYLTALDEIAWISNARGYHLPHLSSFMARAFVTADKLYLLVDQTYKLSDQFQAHHDIKVLKINNDLINLLEVVKGEANINQLNYAPDNLNCADYQALKQVFGEKILVANNQSIVGFYSIKNQAEIMALNESFTASNKAIFNTLNWLKKSVSAQESVSEKDLYDKTSEFYQKEGAICQSFNTIAGVGPNSSIIHYSASSEQIIIKANDLCLLDSGGYFKPGMATDTTRSFLASSTAKPEKWMIEIYTLVLKGVLALQNAVFPAGISGASLDMLARKDMFERGYNFNHGTGHGVGIHVHEPGVRISPVSNLPMKAGQVVSIEPGIYLPKKGGVRLENVALVKKHPDYDGFLYFESFTLIGYDHVLIDYSMLNKTELDQLKSYERACQQVGNCFLKTNDAFWSL
jgi:Xaa-Pro aminopeptidase